MLNACRDVIGCRLLAGILLLFVFLDANTFAHNVPVQLPPPLSVPEAWNVIEESSANVDKLLDEKLPGDVPFQIINQSAAVQYLSVHADQSSKPADIAPLTRQLIAADIRAVLATQPAAVHAAVSSDSIAKVKTAWADERKAMKSLELLYSPQTVQAQVYICPMHPDDRHLDPNGHCSICGMSLVRRHLPASSVYEAPGQPTMKITVEPAPLKVGRRADFKFRLTRADGSPVTMDDLIEMHTKKIHLLINDRSLSDYHHEHPIPTGTPGEYAFSFTPTRPGPYRAWADVIPAATGIQEYVIADLPAQTIGLPLTDRETRFTAIVNRRTYVLNLNTGGKPVSAGRAVIGTIAVTGSDGKPFTQLEPIMGAFAHIVGFFDDGKTVLHIHPYSKAPTGPADRDGPAFAFKFYAPRPGFLRLYGQVQIDGKSQFPAFGVTVLP
jgi:hypothetical protein